MTKKVNERIGFYYLLTKIRPCTLILLASNLFIKNYQAESKTNLSLTALLETRFSGFYRIVFIEYKLVGKNLLHYTDLFSSNDFKNNGKIINKSYNDKCASHNFRL